MKVTHRLPQDAATDSGELTTPKLKNLKILIKHAF